MAAKENRKSVVVLGGGGHASVLIDTLRQLEVPVRGYTAPKQSTLLDLPWLGDDDWLATNPRDGIVLVNGLGNYASGKARVGVFERFTKLGFEFETIVHPSSILSSDVWIDKGAQVLAGALIGPHTVVGVNAIINTRATIYHHCTIGSHSHIAPGVTICGTVDVGEQTAVGAGATVLENLRIGSGSIVAAGATVIANVGQNARVRGVPAKPF